ncbi:ABC transporter ATP-binding protein [Halanaerobium hydrogeniformans]|uniref:ABC transporter related protein n=1 Tax=Halanaerobium hydrogeniformans TaxID=656519 RepID=E4RJG2_HALHG|nr:ATP-binding cassette domain-containing protein [Halanaerobium hydrogeniformans]ADQ15382.1 ABC transporter related protein [Halanaerobium hydrogeniformans]
MFKLENVKFKDILEIDNLSIAEDMITAILGSSGGGKTTFLKLLNNMISSDRGNIYYKGKKIEEYDPVQLRRKVVMLAQEPQIFKGTIRDNFKTTEEITCNEYSDDKVYKNLLEKVSLNKNLDDDAANLSGGERQRLALARVMLLEPETLLLDEPSASLDLETEDVIIKMVANYAKKNKRTLIMVTHNPNVAEEYADEIINIEQGKLV